MCTLKFEKPYVLLGNLCVIQPILIPIKYCNLDWEVDVGRIKESLLMMNWMDMDF